MQSNDSFPMEIVRAEALGLCFGVRDALAAAFALDDPRSVTLHGELVHNKDVQRALTERGFASVPEDARDVPPPTPRVLITAHGVSGRERARLEQAGKQLVDTTCPLVMRAHEAALRLSREGFHVVVIGQPGHVEVRGLVGDLESYDVVARPEDARPLPHTRLGLVCQTTTPERVVHAVREALSAANPQAELRFVDTACQPTKDRQLALQRLLEQVDAVVVVGGRHSNNTRELVRSCAERGVRALHVERPGELEAAWFEGCRRVGLTAGTSTPDEQVDAVHAALEEIANRRGTRA